MYRKVWRFKSSSAHQVLDCLLIRLYNLVIVSECAPYRSLPEAASPQEVVDELYFSIDQVIESSRGRLEESFDSEDGTREDVKRSIKNLRQRTELLAGAIDNDSDPESMAILDNYLKKYTAGIEAAMPAVATSRLLLSKMIYRYGMGIQIQISRLKLIDEETKLKLKEIDNDVLFLTDQ